MCGAEFASDEKGMQMLKDKITDEDVKDCPTFKAIAKNLAAQIEGCDLAGYNSNRFEY